MSKVLWIKTNDREIVETTINDLDMAGAADIRRLVGGHFELGLGFDNGDVLYVHSEWTRGPRQQFFDVGTGPIGDNAVIVGPEKPENGNFDVKMSVEKARKVVAFLTRQQADRYVQLVANLPATTINGVVVQTAAQWWDEVMSLPAAGDRS